VHAHSPIGISIGWSFFLIISPLAGRSLRACRTAPRARNPLADRFACRPVKVSWPPAPRSGTCPITLRRPMQTAAPSIQLAGRSFPALPIGWTFSLRCLLAHALCPPAAHW